MNIGNVQIKHLKIRYIFIAWMLLVHNTTFKRQYHCMLQGNNTLDSCCCSLLLLCGHCCISCDFYSLPYSLKRRKTWNPCSAGTGHWNTTASKRKILAGATCKKEHFMLGCGQHHSQATSPVSCWSTGWLKGIKTDQQIVGRQEGTLCSFSNAGLFL